MLEIFPDAKEQNVSNTIKNLASFTIEDFFDFIVSTVIPRLTVVWKKDCEVAITEIASTSISITVEEEKVNDGNVPTSVHVND